MQYVSQLYNLFYTCRYDAFDFHKECSKMRWHRLSILTDRLGPKQAEFGLATYILALLNVYVEDQLKTSSPF